MNFITLTSVSDKRPVYINLNKVAKIKRDLRNDLTRISFTDFIEQATVIETPEQIFLACCVKPMTIKEVEQQTQTKLAI